MHYPWNILDLEGTDHSERDVKRAYAKKLKQIDPSQDPEGFQNLRQAYEFAREMAKSQATTGSPKPVILRQPAPEIVDDFDTPPFETPVLPDLAKPSENAADFGKQYNWVDVEEVSQDAMNLIGAGNYSLDTWSELLCHPALDLPHAISDLESQLVAEVHLAIQGRRPGGFAAKKAWVQLIEDRFGWLEDGLKFNRHFPEHEVVRARFGVMLYDKKSAEMKKVKQINDKQKTPIYLRFWFIVLAYYVFRYLVLSRI